MMSTTPIFVVDPDAEERDRVQVLLRQGGFRTKAYSDGEQALTAIHRERPLLVLLEVGLGDVSGYEVCRTLKETYGEDVPVVFMSGDRIEPSDRTAGLLLGADDYVIKPLHKAELLARVLAVLRRVQPRIEHGGPNGWTAGDMLAEARWETAETRDARGRSIVLELERWRHICKAHPELRPYRIDLLRAVGEAHHVLPDRAVGEEWFYAEGVGPSRWLKIIVVFAYDGAGRIITAFPRRRKP